MTGVIQSGAVRAVVDEFGPSDLSKIADDYDVETQNGNYAAGNFLARFVFGPGTHLSVLDGLPWSTQRVMGEITTFLAKQLG